MKNVINRHLNLLDFSLLSLLQNRMKNLGMLVVFTLVVFFLASFQLFTGSLQYMSDQLLENVPDITIQQLSAGRQINMDVSVADRLSGIYGIRSITGRIWGYYFDESNGANYTIVGVDSFDGFPALPPQKTSAVHQTIIGEGVEQVRGLIGRKSYTFFRPDLSQQSFEKAAVFDRNTNALTADMVLMHTQAARELFGMKQTEITDLLVKAGNPTEIDTIAKKIRAALPSTRVITKEQIAKTYHGVFGWRSGVGSIALAGGILAFMILAWERASGFSREDRRQTAILRGIGFQASDILTIRIYETFCLSISAYLAGLALAWIHIAWFNGILFRPLLLGWSVLKPDFDLLPHITVNDLVLLFSLSVIPYWCAAIIPAWRSTLVRADSVV